MSAPAGERSAIVVDQHVLWMESVARVAERAGVRVALMTSSPAEALARLRELRPDLLITGITMDEGEIDGLALLREALRALAGLRTLVLSELHDDAHIQAAFAAGADAYVLKSTQADDLTTAIRQTFRPSIHLPCNRCLQGAPATGHGAAALTPREREILELVAQGHSNAQLAAMLWVSPQTVKFHLSNIYRKLEVSNRTEASRCAHRQGLLGGASAPLHAVG